ncbi:Delta(12) fatty acid desaturase [Psilocybe cubensis]|uniref:Delta(12) fatty acid desaturase n=1 Tax=Psilocybe cubensis TaxID=181762 RepID=A0ACB8GGC2_PSICU|nr:Delta(12) fatty acid desaturase [Psilocybe cubensis]KAH9474524.1 Delta(12) fatty acid desaturase [Psilocybe cubensis]
MAPKNDDNVSTSAEQSIYRVPDISIKDLLEAIPAHCFKRSALKSSLYIAWDLLVIFCLHRAIVYLNSYIDPAYITLPSSRLYTAVHICLWSVYAFWAGLFGTGLWVIGHECGHKAFSESKAINDSVGWILHSALGVPYYSWRISHAQHHALNAHMTKDQIFVPKTRSQVGLPPLDISREDAFGSRVTAEVKREMYEALGDSPIGAILSPATYLLVGWWAYITTNASGQPHYPKGTNHFNPSSPMFRPHHYNEIMISTAGILLWITCIGLAIQHYGFLSVFRTYLVPYLWVNHWLVLIVFLQHTDPLLPHYRGREFTFARGVLATLDRNLLGDFGSVISWIGCHATHGISETHVVHHVCSKIPHYNAWEASAAVKKKLSEAGVRIPIQGAPGGWSELFRVYKECKFVEDEGDIVFYKNAYGLAQMRPEMPSRDISDSGVEVDSKLRRCCCDNTNARAF